MTLGVCTFVGKHYALESEGARLQRFAFSKQQGSAALFSSVPELVHPTVRYGHEMNRAPGSG